MLQKRVIPCLLLHKGGLYKTVKFKKPTYIGDPINAIKIFNEKEVDELIFLDIDATIQKKEPNYQLIEDIASECFMPLCYGGGVSTINQMKKIYSLGVEKISLSSASILNPSLVKESSNIFGNQSIVITVDYKKDFLGKKRVFINNGKTKTKYTLLEFIEKIEKFGAGEIVVNSIENDGTMKGLDIETIKEVKSLTKIPIIALGGASNIQNIRETFQETSIDAISAGSIFVYKGRLRGVLINYLSPKEIDSLNEKSNL